MKNVYIVILYCALLVSVFTNSVLLAKYNDKKDSYRNLKIMFDEQFDRTIKNHEEIDEK